MNPSIVYRFIAENDQFTEIKAKFIRSILKVSSDRTNESSVGMIAIYL